MESIQDTLLNLVNAVPNCLNDRQKLKSALLDLLPEKKLQINLLLNAYDEGIVARLSKSADATLTALQMVKILMDGYGVTRNAALWSIASWCVILNREDIAEAINELQPISLSQEKCTSAETSSFKESFDLGATYRAGNDFPVGALRIELDGKMQKGECTVTISKSPKHLRDLEGTWFNSQAYVKVKDGDYLAVFPWNYYPWEIDFSTYRIIKVD